MTPAMIVTRWISRVCAEQTLEYPWRSDNVRTTATHPHADRGNEERSVDSDIFRMMVELAGGPRARVVVVPTASQTPDSGPAITRRLFSAFGPESIKTVHIGERTDAASPGIAGVIREATLFMFGGGDQLRLSSMIGGTPMHQALLERYHRGGCVVAGTSAGAAVLPEAMIFQNNRFRVFRKGGIEMTKGLGLIGDTIFDTHFVERSRISRLVHAVATNPALLGLGIEENTGLLIENERKATVLGTGTVIVVDGRAIEINHIGYSENRQPFALTNVVYSILTPGVVYDLQRRTVIDPGPDRSDTEHRSRKRRIGTGTPLARPGNPVFSATEPVPGLHSPPSEIASLRPRRRRRGWRPRPRLGMRYLWSSLLPARTRRRRQIGAWPQR
jgi:cyanophycinase